MTAVLAQPGSPLPGQVRQRFEQAFGTDLSGVRVHHDALAARAADDLDAHAWTSQRHIAFGAGQYAPGTASGDRLIAHELTHVVSQRGHLASGPDATGHDAQEHIAQDQGAEHHADQVADRIVAGGHAGAVPTARTGVARKGRRSGVTKVTIDGREKLMTFNGPMAHTWRLTSADLADGDYTATVEKSRDAQGQPVVRFRINNAPQGLRFQFEYRVEGRELNPYEAVTHGQTVAIHAISSPPAPTTPTSDTQVRFQVKVIDANTFARATGMPASALPEGQFVPRSALALGTPGAGMGALRAPYPFPANTTGVLWTGQHMSDVAVVGGVPTVRGFRAPFATHLRSVMERELGLFGGPAGDATFRLNRGTLGSYAADQWYLYSPGARLVHRGPLDPSVAGAGRDTINAAIGKYGQEYRFSPPPQGTGAYDRLLRSDPGLVCRPGQNCINVPIDEHTAMLGGRRMTIRPGGDPGVSVDIATGRTISTNEPYVFRPPGGRPYSGPGYAANAKTWAASEAELASLGLTSTPITGGMVARGVLRVGGRVLLIYGAYSSVTRIADAPADQRFVVAAEEGGSWLGGWVGAALSSALAGAVVCSETGPGAVICGGAFAIVGGITGSVVGAGLAHDAASTMQDIGDLLRDPIRLNEAALWTFGTADQRRQYYEDLEVLQEAGF